MIFASRGKGTNLLFEMWMKIELDLFFVLILRDMLNQISFPWTHLIFCNKISFYEELEKGFLIFQNLIDH